MGLADGRMRGQWRAISHFAQRRPGSAGRLAGGCLASARRAAAFGLLAELMALGAFCAALVLAALFTLVPPVGAVADANPAASAFICDFGAESIKELTDPALPQAEREVRFRRLLVEHFDLAAISKFALGRYWRSATDSQRAEFKKAHEDFIVHSYAARFADYQGVGFQVAGSVNEAGGVIVVHSRTRISKTEEVFLDWHLHAASGSFVIVDIVIEGVSMAVTQRSEFGSIIQNRGGIDGLIAAMRAKNAEPAGSKAGL
jgi:phospholipid transport system substrate-binding protein